MSNDPGQVAAPAPAPTPPVATIHEADPMPGPLGVVWYGAELDFDAAVARRQAGQDVVVRGSDQIANKRLAYQIEAAVGPASRPQPPEKSAGPFALPHLHQASRHPVGHLFYELNRIKARKKP